MAASALSCETPSLHSTCSGHEVDHSQHESAMSQAVQSLTTWAPESAAAEPSRSAAVAVGEGVRAAYPLGKRAGLGATKCEAPQLLELAECAGDCEQDVYADKTCPSVLTSVCMPDAAAGAGLPETARTAVAGECPHQCSPGVTLRQDDWPPPTQTPQPGSSTAAGDAGAMRGPMQQEGGCGNTGTVATDTSAPKRTVFGKLKQACVRRLRDRSLGTR